MATAARVSCDRCPTSVEFDPKVDKHHVYVVEGSFHQIGPQNRYLPEGWGLLELNVGHDKDVQELCPACVALNRSFMKEPSLFLPAASSDEPKLLPAKTEGPETESS